jgi:hypothetical protein
MISLTVILEGFENSASVSKSSFNIGPNSEQTITLKIDTKEKAQLDKASELG